MKTTNSMFRNLMMMAATIGFASGAWAQEAGEEFTQGGDDTVMIAPVIDGDGSSEELVYQTGVVDEEVADGDGGGEEIVYMTGGGEEVADGGEAIVDGEGVVTGFVDSDGNVIYFRSDSVDAGEEAEMVPLMAQSGAAGNFVTVADATAEQGGIDSGVNMGIDVVDSGPAAFAGPINVETTAAATSAGGSAGGTATHINGGHLSASSQQ